MELKFVVTGQKITYVGDAPVSGSYGRLSMRFEFSPDWDGLYKVAVIDHERYAHPVFVLIGADGTVDADALSVIRFIPGEWTVGVIGTESAPIVLPEIPEQGTESCEEYLIGVFGSATIAQETTSLAVMRVLGGVLNGSDHGAEPATYQAMVNAVISAKGAMEECTEAVAAEETAREAADDALSGDIDAEATSRSNADTALGGRIDGVVTALSEEGTARQTADNAHKTAAVLDHPDGSVTTAKLADGVVTTAKIADSAVTTSEIGTGAVVGSKIADGAISKAKLNSDLKAEIEEKALADNVYTKGQMDNALGSKADVTATYTKTQVDEAIAEEKSERRNVDIVLDGNIDRVESIAKGANQAKSFATYEALVDDLNDARGSSSPGDVYNVGQNLMVVTLEVPDLWVSGKNTETYISYKYVSDAKLLEDMADPTSYGGSGKLQVGYYIVSQLETQKVDLTDYYNKTQVDTALENKESAADATAHRTAATLDHPDGSVTTAKIADSAVTSAKITDSAVTTVKIADGSVTGAKLSAAYEPKSIWHHKTVTITGKDTTSATETIHLSDDVVSEVVLVGKFKRTDTATASGSTGLTTYIYGSNTHSNFTFYFNVGGGSTTQPFFKIVFHAQKCGEVIYTDASNVTGNSSDIWGNYVQAQGQVYNRAVPFYESATTFDSDSLGTNLNNIYIRAYAGIAENTEIEVWWR